MIEESKEEEKEVKNERKEDEMVKEKPNTPNMPKQFNTIILVGCLLFILNHLERSII